MCKNVLTSLYLPFSHCHSLAPPDAISTQSTVYWADQRIIFSNSQHANSNSSRLYLFFEEEKAQRTSCRLQGGKRCSWGIWYSYTCQSPIKASIISLTWSREQRGCEITASEELNTCQSDPQWQATLLLPTLITQINIKLNTRSCSVNCYAVKKDWLFASLHQRDQSTREGYKSAMCPDRKTRSVPFTIYNCQGSVSALPATSADGSHTILCDLSLSASGKELQWDCLNTCTTYINEL